MGHFSTRLSMSAAPMFTMNRGAGVSKGVDIISLEEGERTPTGLETHICPKKSSITGAAFLALRP